MCDGVGGPGLRPGGQVPLLPRAVRHQPLVPRPDAVLHQVRSSRTGRALVIHSVAGSVPRGGPVELFLVPDSGSLLVYVLASLWDSAYKIFFAHNHQKE